MRVNAVAYFRVIDPNKAITEVENFLLATSQIAQTTLRSVLGKAELDALLSERERLNLELQQIIDEQTEPWGVKVTTVEVKDVELPADMQRAIARQAEAERERRAKIIAADGEFQAAEKLSQAANIISENPATLQLRYLQTLLEIGVNNSTIVFPLPLDLLKPLSSRTRAERPRAGAARGRRRPTPQRRRDPERARGPDRPAHRPAGDPRPGPGRAPGRVRPAPAGADGPTPPSAARSARAARTAPRPRSGRTGPAAAAPDTPGWPQRSVPNLYPVLGARPSPAAAPAASRRDRDRHRRARSIRSAAASRGERSTCSLRSPADGAHEVIVARARARRPRSPQLDDERLRRRGRGVAGADARPSATRPTST